MAKALGVVNIFVSGQSPKYGLPQHPNECMPAILAGAGVSEHLARHRRQSDASSSSRYASKPASEVTTDPRNWSISRRSKLSLRTSAFDSPAEFAMTASFDPK